MIRCEVVTPWRRVNGVNEMAVALDYPGEWSDATWQPDETVLNGHDVFVARGVVSEAQLTALQADSQYVVLWFADASEDAPEPDDLTPEQADALKAKIASVYHSDVAALAVAETVKPVEIAARMVEAAQYPPWKPGIYVQAGEVYMFERNLFEVIQGHTTQADWTPDKVPALFKRFYEPTDDPWPWVQPLGAHDSYPVGARVLHSGAVWVSDIDANVWEPGVHGWTKVSGGDPEPETPPEFKQPTGAHDAYSIGDRVTFEGNIYESLIDANVWSPTAHPQGWQLIGPA